MSAEMYSNYLWPPQPSQNGFYPFQLPHQQEVLQQPFALSQPSSSASTTTNENARVVSDVQDSPTTTENKESFDESFLIKHEPSFQLTAASEGIQLEELKQRIKVGIVEEELFNKFKDVQLEMVITKTGRNLFPKLIFTVQGLEPNNCYLFSVMFKRVDDVKYKFTRSQWTENGPADDEFKQEEFPHSSNSLFLTGSQWMGSKISFSTLKLTNNQENKSKNAVVLRSMHKYRPVLIIYRFNPDEPKFTKFIEKEIEVATFIAVTAYQNHAVTKLKVDNNPFARGFRDGGRKRIRSSNPQSEEDEIAAKKITPPAKQYFQPNPLFSTPFFDTLNYLQSWYNPNAMISNEQINNYYTQAFQAQNGMFNSENYMFPMNFDTPQ